MSTTTTNYSMFKSIAGNRETIKPHVDALIAAIEKKNLLDEFPILVNEKFEVIDGQHRLLAAATLGVPISYQVVNGLNLNNVMAINTASRSWSVLDFVESYVKLGYETYIELKKFTQDYNLSISVSANLLNGRGNALGGGDVAKQLRNGTFSINTRTTAGATARLLSAVHKFADFSAKSDRNLAAALWKLSLAEDFDPERLLGKFRTHALTLSKRTNERYYLLELEEVYNFNARDRVTLYVGQA